MADICDGVPHWLHLMWILSQFSFYRSVLASAGLIESTDTCCLIWKYIVHFTSFFPWNVISADVEHRHTATLGVSWILCLLKDYLFGPGYFLKAVFHTMVFCSLSTCTYMIRLTLLFHLPHRKLLPHWQVHFIWARMLLGGYLYNLPLLIPRFSHTGENIRD